MAELSEIMTALRNADKAGDAEGARRLAKIAQGFSRGPDKSVPDSEDAISGTRNLDKPDTATFMDKAKGYGEAALSLGTGVIGGLAGNVAGVARGMLPSNIGTQEGAAEAKGRASEVARSMTFQPRTEEGQTTLQDLGNVLSASKLEGLGPIGSTSLAGVPKALRIAPVAAEEVPLAKTAVSAVKQAKNDGYVVTPRQGNPGSTTANLVEGASGSAKMEKLASIKNQKNTNRLVAEDLGLDASQPITTEALEGIRKSEGVAYKAVKDSGVTLKATEDFKKAVSQLGGDFKAATSELPGLIDAPKIDALIKSLSVEEMSPNAAIEATKYLRSQSTKNLKAGFADPEKGALGTAQRKAANAIDDLIESNLAEKGLKDLADQYQAARIKIAKTHTAEVALNETTGNVDALQLAKMLDKGKPLSGGMEKVAKFARSFSGAARNVDTMKDAANFSLADVAVGGAAHLATGNYLGLAAVGARPAARSIALSKLGQMFVGGSDAEIAQIANKAGISPQMAKVKLSELAAGKAANDPNMNALITVLSDRAEQGR